MSDLRYHYSNPKFDGKPWAIDNRNQWGAHKKKKRKPPTHKRRCKASHGS
jgi:hypothetical protein